MATPVAKQKQQQKREREFNRRVEEDEDKNTDLSSTTDRASGYASKAAGATTRRAKQAGRALSAMWEGLKEKTREGMAGAQQATQGRSPSADMNRTSEEVAEKTAEVSSMTVGAIQRTTTTAVGAMKGFAEGLVSSTGQARLASKKFSAEDAIEVAQWDGHVDTGNGEVPNDSCVLFPHDDTAPQELDLNHAIEATKRLGEDRHEVIVVPLISDEEKRLNGCYVLLKGGGPVYYQPINGGDN